MNITAKFQQIIAIQKYNTDEQIGTLNNTISSKDIERIEKLLEEKLPNEIQELYAFADGQNNDGYGIFFGDAFCRADEIIRQLELSRTLINSGTKTITDPEKSQSLIIQIIDFYRSKVPKRNFFGLQKHWYKLEFDCGPGSLGGPYLYEYENTKISERKILKIDFKELDRISEIIQELHKLENPTYKWDQLKCIIYSNGKYEVERSAYDFDNASHFTSTPQNAIQKKYLHYKWLPIFSDYGGNYIGIDLDPDSKGKKGQVINFGPDEEEMFVLAESLENLFDMLLTEFGKTENGLLNSENHLHEILKEITKNNCP